MTMRTFKIVLSVFILLQLVQGNLIIHEKNPLLGAVKIDNDEDIDDLPNKELRLSLPPKANNKTFVRYQADINGPYEACYYRMDTCNSRNYTITFYNETFALLTYYKTREDCEEKRTSGIDAKYIQLINWYGPMEEIQLKDITKYDSETSIDCSTVDSLITYTLDKCAIYDNDFSVRYKRVQNGLVGDTFNGMECDQWVHSAFYYPVSECHKFSDNTGSYIYRFTTNSSISPFILLGILIMLFI